MRDEARELFDVVEAYVSLEVRHARDFSRVFNALVRARRLARETTRELLPRANEAFTESFDSVWGVTARTISDALKMESPLGLDTARDVARTAVRVLAEELSYSRSLRPVPREVVGLIIESASDQIGRTPTPQTLELARDLAISSLHVKGIDLLTLAIYGFAALASLPVGDGPRNEADRGALTPEDVQVLQQAGILLPPLEEVQRNFEPVWSIFEDAFAAGLATDVEESAIGLREMLDTWNHRLAGPEHLDLYETLTRKLIALLPDALAQLSSTELPPALSNLIDASSRDADDGEVLAHINMALRESTEVLEALVHPDDQENLQAESENSPRLSQSLTRLNSWMEAVLPELERNTRAVRRLSRTTVGRALNWTATTLVGVAGGLVTQVGAPVGGVVSIGLAVVGSRVARYVASLLRLGDSGIPAQPQPTNVTRVPSSD